MPSWWGKSSSKEVKKKGNKESFIDTWHRKFRITSEGKWTTNRKCCSDTISEQAPQSLAGSRSISPSKEVSRCQSFAERPHAQPLPLPGTQLSTSPRADSGHKASTKPGIESIDRDPTPFLFLPLPKPRRLPDGADGSYAEADFGTGSVSSDMSTDSDDPSASRLLSPQASEYENGTKTAINSPSSVKKKDRSRVATRKNSTEMVEPANIFVNNQMIPKSPKRRPLSSQSSHVSNLQIPHHGSFLSAPDSSMSSPSKSPMRASGPELVMNSVFWAGKPCADRPLLGSGHCSSPGSGHNSGHNSIGGDMAGQIFWQHHSRCSPECSPIPSPRMTSPGPSSRIHSGAVTPLHPRVGGATESLANWPECSPIPSPRMTSPGPSSRIHSGAVTPLHPRAGGVTTESHAARSDDGKQQSHRLPLPPLTISNTCPFSPSYSTGTTPIPRSPSRADNPTSPGSRWKKGRLLGRGTFGHVYLGFNSESGEMCAMKEVTLFSDDRKSKESAQQLGQEVALLSRLRHPNIVQYYGSETVDDKLYIYLEYLSGGSIYKILQDYGQLGEIAIRSYTQQILSGLAYLHAKHTLHRDIKGANILVDPHGRVKLADFGMAKHITGQSCPLSFKGSPYWMAPEVINNSSGCNLAVDIWSLGCTVLEMATTKPPWSQFEGVAAMFKIGNSKELPAIPAHLSDDGKDFVRQCLQRNPSHRPSAVQLLEHPFVRNAALLERPVLGPEPKEAIPSVTDAVRSLGIGHAKNLSHLESEGVTKHHQSRRPKKISAFSDAHVPRNISCPVSPITSPLLHSRSPQHMSPRTCASQISSHPAISGSSIPLIGPKQPITYLHESVGMTSRSQNNFYPTNGMPYQDLKPEIFRGVPQASHLFRETVQSENGFPRNLFGRSAKGKGDVRELYDGQFVLTNRVSQRLLKDQKKKNPSLDPRPKSPVLIRKTGV